MSGKRSYLQRAIDSIDHKIAALQQARDIIIEASTKTPERKPRTTRALKEKGAPQA